MIATLSMDEPKEKPATRGPSPPTPSGTLYGMDDAMLVRKTLTGDAEAFGALVRRHERRVFALASAGLGGAARRADVEDCAQEVFLAAYRGLGGLREPEDFGAWLLGIAGLQVRQALKKRGKAKAGPLPRNLQAPPGAESGEEVLRGLARLPDPEREAVALRHLAGRSPEEIAAELGLASGTVRSRISRGLERLRGIMGGGMAC